MKVYVDDNEDYRITYSSRDGSECLESMGMQPIIVESLADYTKQVRKEVCETLSDEIEFSCGIHKEITITHIRDVLRSYYERIEKNK